jgi:hypothetical protein
MEVTEIKQELRHTIEHADSVQLKEIYGLITDYLNSHGNDEEWDLINEKQKAVILKGLEQADAGLGNSFESINERLAAKYGLTK